ncbi:MAG TPA: GDCCVxC domain-containing (seleno)protein, partial [Rhizomicrobium sp.]|nr:GDCCVxC domain-containing (seleno)protein [Rhizomicrobium sp.]
MPGCCWARYCSITAIPLSNAAIILESTITCPVCGHQATEVMPTDACQFFYDCK